MPRTTEIDAFIHGPFKHAVYGALIATLAFVAAGNVEAEAARAELLVLREAVLMDALDEGRCRSLYRALVGTQR